MGKSWEEMATEVLVHGRPGDVGSAALGWQELLRNLGEVKRSLETNVTDLGETWTGPAYDAFRTHVEKLAQDAGRLVEDAEKGTGIVGSLNQAAEHLSRAQAEMPIPAAVVGDVMAARNGTLTLGAGFFETKVKADFLGSWPVEQLGGLADTVTNWFTDKEGEARKVYDRVDNEYQGEAPGMPGETGPLRPEDPSLQTPDLGSGPGAGGLGGMPSAGGMPGGGPSSSPATLDPSGSGYDLGGPPGSGNLPGSGGVTGLDDPGYGTGLAGATPGAGGPPGAGGLGAGGLGAGGLGGGGMSGGAGAGAGGFGGGGALGRPVAPVVPAGMMGGGGGMAGGGAGAGRGGVTGRGAAGGLAGGPAGRGGGVGRGGMGGIAGAGPMGSGAGYDAEEEARSTWLEEDEDVWGADADGAPGVLR